MIYTRTGAAPLITTGVEMLHVAAAVGLGPELTVEDETEHWATMACRSCRTEGGCRVEVDPFDSTVEYSTDWTRVQLATFTGSRARRAPDIWFCPTCIASGHSGKALGERVADLVRGAVGLGAL